MQVADKKMFDEITGCLVDSFDPEQIFLFGSYAWGTPSEGSDIDLLVIVDESDLRPAKRATLAHRCLRDIGIAKDILVRTRAEAEKYRNIHASLESLIFEKGVILYERR